MNKKQAITMLVALKAVYEEGNESQKELANALDLAINALEENERLCLLYSDMANEMARLKSMTGER